MRLFQKLAVTFLVTLFASTLWAQEPYAVLSDNNTVLTFYYDGQWEARGGMDVGPFLTFYENGRFPSVLVGMIRERL